MMDKAFGRVKGFIELYEVRGGDWKPVWAGPNLVANQAADIMASVLAGGTAVNGMYLVYRNDPGAVSITPDKTNTAATYAAASANRGLVRVTTIGEPSLAQVGSDYVNNKITFVGVTDGSAFFPLVPVVDGTSVFYTAALVSIPDELTQADDLIFSCGDLGTAITKAAGAQVGLRWSITFTNP